MNLPLRVGYEGAALLARALASVAPASGGKLLRSFAARRGVRGRFAAFVRRPGRPLLWMHAPSRRRGAAGASGARAGTRTAARGTAGVHLLLSECRAIRAVAGRRFPRRAAVRRDDGCACGARRPRARRRSCSASSMCGRRSRARRPARGVRLGLISATLARGSSRRRGIAAALLRDAYARLDRVGAIERRRRRTPGRTRRAGLAHQRHRRHALRSGVGPRGGGAARFAAARAAARRTADARCRLDVAVGRASSARCMARNPRAASRDADDHRAARADAEHLAPIERWASARRITLCAARRLGRAGGRRRPRRPRRRARRSLRARRRRVRRWGIPRRRTALGARAGGVRCTRGLRAAARRQSRRGAAARARGPPPRRRTRRRSKRRSRRGSTIPWRGGPPATRAREVVRAGLGAAERSYELVAALMR